MYLPVFSWLDTKFHVGVGDVGLTVVEARLLGEVLPHAGEGPVTAKDKIELLANVLIVAGGKKIFKFEHYPVVLYFREKIKRKTNSIKTDSLFECHGGFVNVQVR